MWIVYFILDELFASGTAVFIESAWIAAFKRLQIATVAEMLRSLRRKVSQLKVGSSLLRTTVSFQLYSSRAAGTIESNKNVAISAGTCILHSPLRKHVRLSETFKTSTGEEIDGVHVIVESHGDPTLPATRTIVILPSFSHSAHCASNLADPSPGWWQDIVGPGKAIDTRHFRVVCISVLGSPHSPCNPTAIDPRTGRPWRVTFPQLTPTDLALCHDKVLTTQGLVGPPHGPPIHALVGSSLGGMQALQLASLRPGFASRVIAIASTGRSTPFTVAIRRAQRRAILADPAWHGGNYADHGRNVGPWEGLSMAREIGTMFYRSREEFDSRFAWSPAPNAGPAMRHFTSTQGTWEVESYLAYAGAKFARTYDPNAYLLLSKAMDLQDIGDGVEYPQQHTPPEKEHRWPSRGSYSEAAARIGYNGTRCLLIPVHQDALIPPQELQTLAEAINGRASSASSTDDDYHSNMSGRMGFNTSSKGEHQVDDDGLGPWDWARFPARCVPMSSPYGHDAFLKEPAWLGPRIRYHLEGGLEEQLQAEAVHNTLSHGP